MGIAIGQTLPAHAIQVRTALLFNPGAELSNPLFKWPMSASTAALKEAAEAYKGNYKEDIQSYYSFNEYKRIWVSGSHFNSRAKDLLKRFAEAQYDGLDPKDYLKTVFAKLDEAGIDDKTQAEAELELSASAIAYARHLSSGRIEPSRVRVSAKPEVISVRQILTDFAGTSDVNAQLAKYEPPHEGYKRLREALGRALGARQQVAEKPYIPGGPVLSEGMKDERVPILRARFALNTYSDAPSVMDAELVKAVREFQEQSGLKATGMLTKRTVRALNEQNETKTKRSSAADIAVNMERWRWMPRDLGEISVIVNIPEYLVRVRKGSEITYEGRVVVGKPTTQTPVFTDELEYIVVNPSWHVPQSIIRNEMLPVMDEDPDFWSRRGFEMSQDRNGTLRFRQPPSAMNALGRIKFAFPNNHDVYLHDTPAKGYFERSERAFSHGCVRVDKPLVFADALLANEGKFDAKMMGKMIGGGERTLHLEKHVPIHITYFTAIAHDDGNVTRKNDVYGIDARLKALMGFAKRG
jgi:murein L,D-transpeptidase YcbB/YkuD